MKKAIVLGSGIQGVCCAFALHDEGYDVTLVEKAKDVFNRTSRNQEGRLHMGFTYSLDKSGKTGESVMDAALNFSSVLEEWFGSVKWEDYLMAKGYYLIHKDESLLNEDEVLSYYERLNTLYQDRLKDNRNLSYFGKKPKKIFKALKTVPSFMSAAKVSRVIKTEEWVIEMFYFRDLVVKNLKRRNINILTETEAKLAERAKNGFNVIVVDKDNQERKLSADIVVNCLWNNRIHFDKTMGISPMKDPLYRLKIGLLGTVDKPVPNVSIISGAFGNTSPRLDGKHAYISWHTDCVHDIATDGITPEHWEDALKRNFPNDSKSAWITNTIKNVSEFIPAVSTFKLTELLPGIICSAGKTDIHDKNSDVHNRGEHIGVYAFDGYYSMDTGKFSTAPLFAKKLINEIKEGH